ncbi:MAG: DUF2183 domain-containing protein [Thiothrix sp.]|nr:MAG: DUF2183 domain-containing protein [Thiothrix sp.]
MTSFKETLETLGEIVSERFDSLSAKFKKRLHYDEPIQIVPFAGYGNQQGIKVTGRALEDKARDQGQDEESLWQNLAQAYQRFESDEIPDLHLKLHFQGQTLDVITDKEGYFEAALPVSNLDSSVLWYDYQVEVPAQERLKQPCQPVTGKVQIPSPDCDFGIISDIDDTIMVTNATSTLSMMRLTFLRSPASRLPFAGVNTFYQALTQSGSVPRPIFYVSSSPWNLYDFLVEFMELNHIPLGTLCLRDFGLHTLTASHHNHKSTYITQIMDTYPELSFILIGDSGQHDPEVYSELVTQRPQQIKAVYIRDVSTEEARDNEVLRLAEITRTHQVDLCLVENTIEAATHAVAKGYIPASVLDELKTALEQTDSAQAKVEEILGR